MTPTLVTLYGNDYSRIVNLGGVGGGGVDLSAESYPAMGVAFTSILSAVGAVVAKGASSIAKGVQSSRKRKAASRKARRQAAAAAASAEAARKARTRNLLIIGGGVAALGLGTYYLTRGQ